MLTTLRHHIQLLKSASNALKAVLLLAGLMVFGMFLQARQDSKAVGDSVFISNGLTGKINGLPVNTRQLPDFDTMVSSRTLYVDFVNIAPRSWSAGFTGLKDRFEWFGIQYTGFFQPAKAGEYAFRLLSDDGSKLFVDDSLVINNDGQHGLFSRSARILLDEPSHRIKIPYFQGPRYQLALLLFVQTGDSKEEIFPGRYLTPYTEWPSAEFKRYSMLLVGLVLLIILWVIVQNNERKKFRDVSMEI